MRTQSILGKVSSGTHEPSFGVAYLVLRCVVGGAFLYTGWQKLSAGWSFALYFSSATGPFAEWFRAIAQMSVLSHLDAWGAILIGIALLLGLCTRPAALYGMFCMSVYYLAHIGESGTGDVISVHALTFFILGLFASGGAGHAFGVNAIVLGNLRHPSSLIRFIFG